jgi:uncharacterized protein YebE (UPF0316 family)
MDFIAASQSIWIALGIFALQLCSVAFNTLRKPFVERGQRVFALVLSFLQALAFAGALVLMLAHPGNPLGMLGFAAGYAVGVVIGMSLEERLSMATVHFSIISSLRGVAIADQLRADGFAVTEVPARGRNGTVSMLHVDVDRKDIDTVETVVLEVDNEAFVTFDSIRPVRRGFWRR